MTLLQPAFRRLLFACLPLAALVPDRVQAQEIIAHRGASHDAPENTLEAMKLGWEQGAEAVELDLWLSADGQPVVFHDADTRRFEDTPRKIKSMTCAEIAKLDVGVHKGPQFRGIRVPTLESILKAMPAGRKVVLELKDGPEVVPAVVAVLRAAGTRMESLCVISFQEATLRASKKELPEVPHYFLKGYKADPATGALPQLEPLLQLCRDAGFEGLNLHFDWPVTPAFVKQVKESGLKLLIWTVDDASVARRLRAAGVDAITTNRPASLREDLKAPH